MLQVPWVTCAVCNKPVDRMGVQVDERAGVYMVIAQCHGAVDVATIPVCELVSATTIEPSLAFIPPSNNHSQLE